MSEKLRSALRELLLERAQPASEWSYSTRSRQTATEPTALAILATGVRPTALTRMQHQDGSWTPVHLYGSPCWPTSWTTSLALITLLHTEPGSAAIAKAVHWLCSSRGMESHWLWRWKFKTVDTQVSFDPDKFGWNWAPDTASWVIPTAFAILALRLAEKQISGTKASRTRIQLGIEMLLDRACPGGGWNAGNGVAFGVALAPHVEATAIALLALQGTPASRSQLAADSLGWLIDQTGQCRGITSAAWAILAIHAYHRDGELAGKRHDHLARLLEAPRQVTDNSALAVSALALDTVDGRNVFGVVE
ncbi:MAG: hypothetical protein ACRD7E_22485 [Bryobacteraceae bacterium]